MMGDGTSLRRTAPMSLLYGSVSHIEAFLTSGRDRSWREPHIGGVICTDGGATNVLGCRVLGRALDRAALGQVSEPIKNVVLCSDDDGRATLRAFLRAASDLGLKPMLARTRNRRTLVRRITLADLIGQGAAAPDMAGVRAALAGKRILVTGAGGSIGSEICRQLVSLWPSQVSLLDSCEFNLYQIDHDLAARAPDLPRTRILCDIRDGEAVSRWFRRVKPDLVLHVAALKHVPIVEEFVSEGVLTNVLGTRNVAEAALSCGAHMMLVSTDKAVEPYSMMGATKRTAEVLCQALDARSARARGPRLVVARLGNVLGSTGSVTPMFDKQIAGGGPVTVTDPDVARYFITIPQAASFLLHAFAGGIAPEAPSGAALVLDMGEPVRVVDLACDMIRLKGMRPGEDIAVKFVGLRPGEKLTERLIEDGERVVGGAGPGIVAVAGASLELRVLRAEIDRMVMLARAGHDDLLRAQLTALVGAQEEAALAV